MSAAERLSAIAPDAPMVEFALDYARRGWPVFPCRPHDKRPYTITGFKDATTDADQINTWWRQWPRAMIGVRMGAAAGVWTLDPDAPKEAGNPDGKAAWEKLTATHGAIHTHAHQTPGDGLHLLFRWDADRPVTNKEGDLKGTGINVRGEGGYIIAPPSRRQDGKAYEVVEPLDFFRFADAPDWLYDMILAKPAEFSISQRAMALVQPRDRNRRAYAEAALRGECDEVAATTRDRNVALNNAAIKLGSLVGAGELSEGEVIGALYDAAATCGYVASDGQRATMATINSGLQAGIRTPRQIPDRSQSWDNPAIGHDHASGQGEKPPGQVIELFWHGKNYDRAPRSWLAKDLIPETGCGILAGQWGTAKTFTGIDLSASVMTGTPFAGRPINRKGGVLFVAAEGASEIPIRLQGVVDHKLTPMKMVEAAAGNPIDVDLEALPFAWIEECPNLKDGFDRLVAMAQSAASHLEEQFGLPLVLIIIDTLNAAANFKDGNDAAEGQFIMNRLNELSRRTGAFSLAVDHFGKAVETGTRGSSAKEAAADMVLALLADRDVSGSVSNTRMAVRKLRGGSTGAETPFDLKVVDLGNDETTCIIEWRNGHDDPKKNKTGNKDRWPQSLRVLRASMLNALTEDGKMVQPFGTNGPTVRAVADVVVRTEFKARYPVNSENKDDAKRMAYNRALKTAIDKELICSWEIGGVDHLWMPDEKNNQHTTRPNEQDT